MKCFGQSAAALNAGMLVALGFSSLLGRRLVISLVTSSRQLPRSSTILAGWLAVGATLLGCTLLEVDRL
jgi:hypothetical protein